MGSAVGRFAAGIAIGLAVAWIYYIVVFIAPDGSVVWLVSLAPVLVIAFFIGYRVPDDVVKRWSKSHGVAITDENRDVLLRHLNRGRRIRTAGAVLGFLGYMVFTVEIAKDDASWGILRSTFFGYLIGAGIAEVWALRLRAQGPRVASLAPRAIRDYLPRLALFTLRLAALGTVALAVAWHWIPTGRDSDGFSRPDVGWIAMWAGISAVVSIFAELVMRSIVRRPQPAVSDELLRVDDAIRSSSIHQLA